jgi:hypothetical protein
MLEQGTVEYIIKVLKQANRIISAHYDLLSP